MLLISTNTALPIVILDFLCIFGAFLLKRSLHCTQNIHPSKRYALSRNVFSNNSDIFPKYDILYNFSLDLRFYWLTLAALFLSCDEYASTLRFGRVRTEVSQTSFPFICFHISNNNLMLLTYLVRKLFYIIRYQLWCPQLLSVLAYENNMVL